MQNMYRILFFLFVSLAFISCNNKGSNYQDITFNKALLNKVDTLEFKVDRLIQAISDANDTMAISQAFIDSRLAYKEIQWAVSYFLPHTTLSINGPALDQLDLDENKFIPAQGFQVVEEMIYPSVSLSDNKELLLQSRIIKNLAHTIKRHFEVISMNETQILEALKLEIFQITALGITGFDTPVSKLQFLEAASSLQGVKQTLELHKNWEQSPYYNPLLLKVEKAIAICQENPDKNTFDYLGFITNYLEPISLDIVAMQEELGIEFNTSNQAVNPNVGSLFDKDLINLNAFLADSTYYLTPQKVALGKELFSEKKLSKNSVRSCADCHHKDKAFSDGLKTALDLNGLPLKRNTPSLNYAAYYHGQFWDMRSLTLESQSSEVITDKDEMHGDLNEILIFLNSSDSYKEKFSQAYNTKGDIQVWQLENALGTYIRSLSVFNSDFDKYMQGDKTALNEQQKNGFNLFVGKGQCATCHFMPLFNGTVPPYFIQSEQEVLGVPLDPDAKYLDTDLGRYVFNTDLHQLKHSFKTSTVRNIAQSAPYMHNGVYNTLEQVMDFYNQGGGLGLGLQVDSQTLPEDPLNLTDQEIQDIIAFMHALSDQEQ